MTEVHLRSAFKDASLYDLAMTHRGLAAGENNQRLEFLGDRVLGLVVANMLYDAFPDSKEGELATRFAALVCGETLAEVARKLGLGEQISLADSEVTAGGRDNASNLMDACEALIGAIYRDRGLEAAELFIKTHWQPMLKTLTKAPKDAKTALQEWVQARGLSLPVYEEISREGSAHAPVFEIAVRVEGYEMVTAKAGSKRIAEQAAAKAMLVALGEEA